MRGIPAIIILMICTGSCIIPTQSQESDLNRDNIETVLTIERDAGISCSVNGSTIKFWGLPQRNGRYSVTYSSSDLLDLTVIARPNKQNQNREIIYALINKETSTFIGRHSETRLGSTSDRPEGVNIVMEKTELILLLRWAEDTD